MNAFKRARNLKRRDKPDILVINLNEYPVECFVCGESAPNTLGIPVYEDIILHNDWGGEWFGQSACQRCFDLQNELNKPMSLNQFQEHLNGEFAEDFPEFC